MKWCIDAGHCSLGGDTGAEGNGLKEQDITWLIADKLRILLEAAGQEVVMTREHKDQILGITEEESLNRRSKICNDAGCDRFVSIHGNSFEDPQAHGSEVLIYAFGGQAEKLADAVQKEIVDKLGTYDRGVKVKNCSVLRKTNCPAILVETAFLSNEADSLLLRYRHDDFAEAIFNGICEYCGINVTNQFELITANDIVWELGNRGVVTDTKGMLDEINQHPNCRLYWLARKFANHLREEH